MSEFTLDSIALARPKLHQRSGFKEIVELVPLFVLVFVIVNLASARFVVEGDSMQPNFHSGQFILVSRANYMVTPPQRGDIVVFHYPLGPESDYIKRVVGLPGQTVEIRDTRVFVNGVQLDEPYINEPCTTGSCPNRTWTLGPNQIFVMGDNRNHSQDSRAFGPVDMKFVVGEALLRYWPPSDWGSVIKLRASAAQ
jgi:signal peptidase I